MVVVERPRCKSIKLEEGVRVGMPEMVSGWVQPLLVSEDCVCFVVSVTYFKRDE